MTLLVGEDRARLSGGAGIAAAVRETLACDTLDSSRDGEGQEGRQRLLENVDALIVARDSGRWEKVTCPTFPGRQSSF